MPEHQHREVLVDWRRLVADKLLARPASFNSFVTDFGCTGGNGSAPANETTDFVEGEKEVVEYKIFVSTWNVGGVEPPEDLNMRDLMGVENGTYDIYVLGFQEVVPLTAKNVLRHESSPIAGRWNFLIEATLDSPEKKMNSECGFRCVASKQMVGILVSVWARGDLCRHIRHASISCVGCGVLGCLGNKGSVSVRFWLKETSFCFVCCHLASGGKEGDETRRNSDVAEILSRTSFPPRHSLESPQKILDHDRIIMLGDLNYRISLPETKTRFLAQREQWKVLLEHDQLRAEMSRGRTFQSWREGAIEFPPTYKYYPSSDTYYSSFRGSSSGEKNRAPAWCDRILWIGDGISQTWYNRYESLLSDHRPVRALFTVTG